MSGAIDVNLLLYSVDARSPFHEQTLRFFESLFKKDVALYITWDVVHSFLRIATDLRIFTDPLTPAAAIDNLKKIIEHSSVTALGSSSDSWRILSQLTDELHLRENLITDAVTASILEANGIKTIYTNDRDFWKFPYLKPINPFDHAKEAKSH